MTIQEKFIEIFGNPLKDRVTFEKKFMKLFKYSSIITSNIPSLGSSVYCNINFYPIYEKFLLKLIETGLYKEILTNDECYNIRYVRGIEGLLSIHSWVWLLI